MTSEQAQAILDDLRNDRWSFMKGVKRFKPEVFSSIEERYAALEQHHKEETQFLMKLLKELCELVGRGHDVK